MHFQEKDIAGKQVFICEHHHHVLNFWHRFRYLNPYLLTFDHHTDLHKPFQGHLYRRDINRSYVSQAEYHAERDSLVSKVAGGDAPTIDLLEHDEHIQTAIDAGIIHKALVYAEDSYYTRPLDIYSINGDEEYEGQSIINNPRDHKDYDLAISTPELVQDFKRFGLCMAQEEWIDNFILDIDLDFLKLVKLFSQRMVVFSSLLYTSQEQSL